ncbi:MAG: hypothetical protein CMH61_01705 [Nanoarchaeota archaeon]|nr:hypothetical protein [Nanoarchaeota archaeon]|tara:strand:+ start:5913 stop:6332 length:420 start_codon:yes stop_codon:yes gene_type:complete
MNRKAESAFALAKKTIFWTFASIFIIGFIFFFGFQVKNFERILVNVPVESTAESLSLRFTHSCFSNEPFVIEMDQFTNEHVRECYTSTGRKDFNFKIDVVGQSVQTEHYYTGSPTFTVKKSVLVDGKNEEMIIHVQETV